MYDATQRDEEIERDRGLQEELRESGRPPFHTIHPRLVGWSTRGEAVRFTFPGRLSREIFLQGEADAERNMEIYANFRKTHWFNPDISFSCSTSDEPGKYLVVTLGDNVPSTEEIVQILRLVQMAPEVMLDPARHAVFPLTQAERERYERQEVVPSVPYSSLPREQRIAYNELPSPGVLLRALEMIPELGTQLLFLRRMVSDTQSFVNDVRTNKTPSVTEGKEKPKQER